MKYEKVYFVVICVVLFLIIISMNVLYNLSYFSVDRVLNGSKIENIRFETINQVNKFGDPVHIDDLQEIYDHVSSAGVMHGCNLSDNGNGSINISLGYATLRAENNSHTTLYSVEVSAQNNIVLTDNRTNYVYLDYNGGSPQFNVGLSLLDFNCQDKCVAYIVSREGTHLDVLDVREQNVDSNRKLRRKELETSRFEHVLYGSVINSIGLNLTLTAGEFYYELTKTPHQAFDTSTGDVFDYYYTSDNGATWTKVEGQTIINNLEYNDPGVGLVTLDNNKFKVDWVYIINNDPSRLAVLYGQEQYLKLADADAAGLPGYAPAAINDLGALVGRVIVEKSALIMETQSSFEQTFSATTPVVHNGLADIQGGGINDYYHFTLVTYTELVNWLDDVILSSNGDLNMSDSNLTANKVSASNWGNVSITESQITDLSHTTDTVLTEAQVEAYIFDNDNTGTLNTTGNIIAENATFNGYVGIGTNTPREKLEISDNLIINGDVAQALHIGYSTTLTQFPGIWSLFDGTPSLTNYRMIFAGTSTEFNAPSGGSMGFSLGNIPYIGLDGGVKFNPNLNDIDNIFYGDTEEVMRTDATTDRLVLADDKYIALGTTNDALFGLDSANSQVLLDLTGVADTNFNIETTGEPLAFGILGSTGAIGIGIAPQANTAMKIDTTGRYGLNFNQVSGAAYPSALSLTSEITGGTQGTGARIAVKSTGATALSDWLTGMNFLVQQARVADGTTMETSGINMQILSEISSDSSFNIGNFYGLKVDVGMGGTSGGAGTQTIPIAAGIISNAIKNNPSVGDVVITDWSAFYAPTSQTWEGAGTLTITSGRGFWSEDQIDATNNINLLLGNNNITGNWSIYSNSAYPSFIANNLTIGDGNDLLQVNGDLNVTGSIINNNVTGKTGNYSVNGCWQAFQNGIFYATNCSVA